MSYSSAYLFLIAFIMCILFVIQQRKFLKLAWELPGPVALPILGNALRFLCKDEDIFDKLNEIVARYPSPMRVWMGPKLVIIFSKIEHVSKIMTSIKFSSKDSIYQFMKEFDGESLITGSGPKWRNDRKMLTHMFVKKNVETYFPIFVPHVNILVKKLETKLDLPEFSVDEYIHRCAADIVNETIIGMKTSAQEGTMDKFLSQINRMYTIVHVRMLKIWLHFDFIFKFTHYGKEHQEGKEDIHGFMRQALYAARDRRKSSADLEPKPFIDMMLDLSEVNPNFATDEEFDHHLTTFYSASEDTMTTISSFCLMLFGMYKSVQNKLVEEINTVIGDREVTLDDIPNLTYLDMCLKEVMRLFPVAPYILRTPSEDVKIGDYLIPQGCSTAISIQSLHYDPELWSNPKEFYPEHFTPEAVQKRPVFAYMPFSAGPRGCLGKPFAYMGMKIILINLLRNYEFTTDGTLADIKLRTDISVRTKDDRYPVRITRRNPEKTI